MEVTEAAFHLPQYPLWGRSALSVQTRSGYKSSILVFQKLENGDLVEVGVGPAKGMSKAAIASSTEVKNPP